MAKYPKRTELGEQVLREMQEEEGLAPRIRSLEEHVNDISSTLDIYIRVRSHEDPEWGRAVAEEARRRGIDWPWEVAQ
jgi:hypothetical protein